VKDFPRATSLLIGLSRSATRSGSAEPICCVAWRIYTAVPMQEVLICYVYNDLWRTRSDSIGMKRTSDTSPAIRMPSALPFLLTLCIVLLCVWLWWRSKQ
jgi:hypothetical protein